MKEQEGKERSSEGKCEEGREGAVKRSSEGKCEEGKEGDEMGCEGKVRERWRTGGRGGEEGGWGWRILWNRLQCASKWGRGG